MSNSQGFHREKHALCPAMNHILHWCQYGGVIEPVLLKGFISSLKRTKKMGKKTKPRSNFGWRTKSIDFMRGHTMNWTICHKSLTIGIFMLLQFFHRLLSDKRMHQKLERTWEMSWAFSQESENPKQKMWQGQQTVKFYWCVNQFIWKVLS
jgi:hypothetical protein